jgi:hypothetical protein
MENFLTMREPVSFSGKTTLLVSQTTRAIVDVSLDGIDSAKHLQSGRLLIITPTLKPTLPAVICEHVRTMAK